MSETPYPATLDDGEMKALNGLVDSWNTFVKLERLHPDECREFQLAIHTAQYLIMVRPVRRQLNRPPAL